MTKTELATLNNSKPGVLYILGKEKLAKEDAPKFIQLTSTKGKAKKDE